MFSSPIFNLSSPTFQLESQEDSIAQLSKEFGLEAEDVQSRIFIKANALFKAGDRDVVFNYARSSARLLLYNLRYLKNFGADIQKIQAVGISSLLDMESTACKMIDNFTQFQSSTKALENRYTQFEAHAAQAMTQAAFSYPASPTPSPLLSVISKYMITPPIQPSSMLDAVRCKVEKKECSLLPFDISEEAREYAVGKVGHKIQHKYGDSASHWFEFGINALISPIPENSKSPWRDRIISAGINISMAEILSLCLPARLPAYLAIAGANTAAEVAKELEVHVDHLAKNTKFAELWNAEIGYSEQSLSFSESIALCKVTLKAAQRPSELYHAVKHKLGLAATQTMDALGITEENLINIAKKTLYLLAKYSPEIMEEDVWRDAILDIKA